MEGAVTIQAMGWMWRIVRFFSTFTKANFYRVKRFVMARSLMREAYFLIHRHVNHEVRNLISEIDDLAIEEEDIAALREKTSNATTKALQAICDQLASHLNRQIPGRISVCVKTIVSPGDLKNSAFYARALQLCGNGLKPGQSREDRLRELAGGSFDSPGSLIAFTRARCRRSSQQRSGLIGFCFTTASSAFQHFDKESNRVLYMPPYDLYPGMQPIKYSDGSADGRYQNPTPGYWEYYRSVAVMPIRLKEINVDSTAGYLCLDSSDPLAFLPVFNVTSNVEEWSPMLHYCLAVADAIGTLIAGETLALEALADRARRQSPEEKAEPPGHRGRNPQPPRQKNSRAKGRR